MTTITGARERVLRQLCAAVQQRPPAQRRSDERQTVQTQSGLLLGQPTDTWHQRNSQSIQILVIVKS